MTIIAACVDHDGNVWMGCDTVSLHRGNDVKRSAESKIFRLGEMLIGSSGTIRCGQIVEHLIDLPQIPNEVNLVSWLVKEFASRLRVTMKGYGGECKNRSGDDEMDGRLLIGLRGKVYELDIGYGIYTHAACYAAIGCADQEASAAMLTALKVFPDMHARAVVQYGLEAAAELDINIRPPFEIICSSQESVAGIHAVA